VIKDGKEHGQGVGYLDDRTMIVAAGGRRFIGEPVGAMVTSALQTAAGRMIFAKPKTMARALSAGAGRRGGPAGRRARRGGGRRRAATRGAADRGRYWAVKHEW